MTGREFTGADAIVSALTDNEVDCVFGVPGSQNIALFDALSQSSVRTVLATDENMAGFMANGWYRASGRPGVFLAMPGPGFANAFAPLSEAALDSNAVVLITGQPPGKGRLYDLQTIDQKRVANAICKHVYDADNADSIAEFVRKSIDKATQFGPGPVVLQHTRDALDGRCNERSERPEGIDERSSNGLISLTLMKQLLTCKRPLVFAGSGSAEWAVELQLFVEKINGVVKTTPAARGTIPENSWRVVTSDLIADDTNALNCMIGECDLIIALGCRFSHNGTAGYSLQFPKERLVHVHDNPLVLNANYQAQWAIACDVGDFLSEAMQQLEHRKNGATGGWTESNVKTWRRKIDARSVNCRSEPVWRCTLDQGCQQLFEEIRAGIPDNGILVTDTGNHQVLARKYYEVRSPRGLVIPCDFQSMGFGLPAAIGAALSAPHRPTVALIGDGSFLMTAPELITVVREKIPLVILIFHDGWLGQIRMQQLESGRSEFATKLQLPDIKMLAESMGLKYTLATRNLRIQIADCIASRLPALIEIRMGDPLGIGKMKKIVSAKKKLKAILGARGTSFAKGVIGR